jgi:hypothetical protein
MRLVFLTAILAAISFGQSKTAAEPVRVLIVDGMNNHDWLAATSAVRGFLTRSGRFLVDVSTTPPATASAREWDGWRPDFTGYQAVIVNFNSGDKANSVRWPPRVEVSFEKYVRDGGGAVFLHAANNAFLNWKAYNEMIGLGWREKSFGPGLRVTEDGKVVEVPKGAGFDPGHGPRHDFQVHVLDRDHPITRGMPSVWMHPSEQLTHGQHGPAQGLTILTYALSDVTHQNEPMDWVRAYGKGRVYVTMLGHTWKGEADPDIYCAGFQTLFSRGVEWAATSRVTIPIPPDFPGPDRTVERAPTEH